MYDEKRLPPLEGTAKQIKWALQIRKWKLNSPYASYWNSSEMDAKYWIENRDKKRETDKQTNFTPSEDTKFAKSLEAIISKNTIPKPKLSAEEEFDLICEKYRQEEEEMPEDEFCYEDNLDKLSSHSEHF